MCIGFNAYDYLLLLLNYFHKNDIRLRNGVNYDDTTSSNVLLWLFKRPHLDQDWVNLLSNICNQCKINIQKEYIEEALDYVKQQRESHDSFIRNKYQQTDYESMILGKFKRIDE